MLPAPTTKLGYWHPAKHVKRGQYFKYGGHWYLAISDAVPASGELAQQYAWAIQAITSDGADKWVGIWRRYSEDEPELVEAYAAGKRPGPFSPATLRRKARALEEECQRLRYAAYLKETLARRLENGTIAG